ncbi:MAG: GreA/GreB family elongation factor [Bacteroidota bacterium]
MSRGFVKESDQEELPLIPLRAPLPAGAINYVTPAGFATLEQEQRDLEAEKAAISTAHEAEYRRAATVIDGKLALLNQRIHSARVLRLEDQPQEEVRFGATVRLRMGAGGPEKTFQIVGVDEANIKAGKLAFTAPLAKVITGLWVNETVAFRMAGQLKDLTVLAISY